MLILEQLVFRTITQIEPAQKILVAGGRHLVVLLLMQILDIGFGKRVHAFHGSHESALTRDEAVHGLRERNGRQCLERGMLRDTVVAIDSHIGIAVSPSKCWERRADEKS